MSVVDVEHDHCCCHDHTAYLNTTYGVDENGEFKEKNDYGCNSAFLVKNLPKTGGSVIEVGCGPCVHKAASLSAAFDEVYLVELREDGRELIKKWQTRMPDAWDWTPLFRIIAQEEGRGSDIKTVEERVRKKIKAVAFADVHQPHVGLRRNEVPLRGYDAVASFGTLTVASNTMNQYKNAVKNFLSLVKPGGLIIYNDGLQPVKDVTASDSHGHHQLHGQWHGHSHEHHGHEQEHGHEHGHQQEDYNFPHGVPLSGEKVKPVLVENGVKILSWEEFEHWDQGFGDFLMLGQMAD